LQDIGCSLFGKSCFGKLCSSHSFNGIESKGIKYSKAAGL